MTQAAMRASAFSQMQAVEDFLGLPHQVRHEKWFSERNPHATAPPRAEFFLDVSRLATNTREYFQYSPDLAIFVELPPSSPGIRKSQISNRGIVVGLEQSVGAVAAEITCNRFHSVAHQVANKRIVVYYQHLNVM